MTRTAPAIGRRRRLGRAFAEMHHQLRTGRHSPARTALSVWLGTIVGCTPFYGFHLPLCIGLGTLLRLSRVKAYLAAHVGNPLTAPFLLYAEATAGHWLLTGSVPALSVDSWRSMGLLAIGRDVLVGSLAVGAVLGACFAAVAYLVSSAWRSPSSEQELVERVSRPYLESGILQWEFVRGKLRHDPVYLAVLTGDLLPSAGHVVDLGCGRGILLALLDAVAGIPDEELPEGWATVPRGLSFEGVDARPEALEVARRALGGRVALSVADLKDYRPPPCDVVVLLDVLHYLDGAEQERVLSSAVAALRAGGRVLLREPDAADGLRFLITRIGKRARAIGRGAWRQRFRFRTHDEWIGLLESRGLAVERVRVGPGAPAGSTLLLARKQALPFRRDIGEARAGRSAAVVAGRDPGAPAEIRSARAREISRSR